jgi:hypothetical protein
MNKFIAESLREFLTKETFYTHAVWTKRNIQHNNNRIHYGVLKF